MPDTMTIEPFVWDRDYKNLEQVARFLPVFLEVFAEVGRSAGFAYNDDFRGKIRGIAGTDGEDTAIYLLQGLKRAREQSARVVELEAQGYVWIETVASAGERFAHVVLVPVGRMQGEWAEYRDCRLIPETRAQQARITGAVYGVLPKGKRTHGHMVNGRRVLALRKAVSA